LRATKVSVGVFACHYLHHATPRPHIRPHTLTTPLHPKTLHSHLPPDHTPAPHSHFYFAYKLPACHVLMGFILSAVKDRATHHIHLNHFINTHKYQPPHPLAKYTQTPWLYPLPTLTKERSSVGCAQAPHWLASCWCSP